MQMRELALPPPVGFRKAIPVTVKLQVVLAQGAKCTACGQRLGKLDEIEFDHTPAIQLRTWDPVRKDTIPACNDPEFIEAKHIDCHAAKTTGRKGESNLTRRQGDQYEISKTRRLTEREEAFRRQMLSRGEPEPEEESNKKPKRQWPKRPFPKGSKG